MGNHLLHPQTKFAKVMILHLSVSHSVHIGGIPACLAAGLQRGIPACLAAGLWGIPACLAGFQAHTQGGSLRESGRGVSRPIPKGEIEGIWPGGSPGPHLGGTCSRGVPAPGEVPALGGVEIPP